MRDGKTYILGIGGYNGTNPNVSGVQDIATAHNTHITNTSNPHGVTASQIGAIKYPTYNGQNHAFLAATDLVPGEDFSAKGLHRWTIPRKGIVYVRLMSGTNSATIRLGLNVAAGATNVDDAHCVTALSKFKNDSSVVIPLFLNAGDEVCLLVDTNPLQYVLFTCFYTDD